MGSWWGLCFQENLSLRSEWAKWQILIIRHPIGYYWKKAMALHLRQHFWLVNYFQEPTQQNSSGQATTNSLYRKLYNKKNGGCLPRSTESFTWPKNVVELSEIAPVYGQYRTLPQYTKSRKTAMFIVSIQEWKTVLSAKRLDILFSAQQIIVPHQTWVFQVYWKYTFAS